MEIVLKLEEQDIELPVNLTNYAGRIYRQTFERDMLLDMQDIYKKLNKSPFDGIDLRDIQTAGKTKDEIADELIAKANLSAFIDNERPVLSFEDTEKAGQIIWAFAKNENKGIKSYNDWIDEFDFILPVGQIVTALYNAWNKSAQPTIEIKN